MLMVPILAQSVHYEVFYMPFGVGTPVPIFTLNYTETCPNIWRKCAALRLYVHLGSLHIWGDFRAVWFGFEPATCNFGIRVSAVHF